MGDNTDALLSAGELDELEAKAKAATPGPWVECGSGKEDGCACGYIFGHSGEAYIAKTLTLADDVDPATTPERAIANARFIVAANPAEVLRLLSAYRAQEARLAKYACPLGAEPGCSTCSAGSCLECLADRQLAEARAALKAGDRERQNLRRMAHLIKKDLSAYAETEYLGKPRPDAVVPYYKLHRVWVWAYYMLLEGECGAIDDAALAELADLRAQVERQAEALGFYASLPNYELDGNGTTAVRMDRGRKAFAALNEQRKDDGAGE